MFRHFRSRELVVLLSSLAAIGAVTVGLRALPDVSPTTAALALLLVVLGAATLARLPEKPCVTRNLNVHGFHRQADHFGSLAVYGSDALLIQDLIRGDASLAEPLHAALQCCQRSSAGWCIRFDVVNVVGGGVDQPSDPLLSPAFRQRMRCVNHRVG